MNIRRANLTEEQDAKGIIEAHRKAIHGTAAPFYSKDIIVEWGSLPITPEMVGRFVGSKGQGEVMYVAEASGKIVGFSEVIPQANELRAVYVDPDFGRRGLGAKLLGAVESDAKNAGCKRLWTHSSVNAKAFYERNGYAVVRQEMHTLSSGRTMPCFVMEKNL
ncbi:N-acetyltransferase [Nitrospira sp. KM1]|uniref:GNAT family N-acetyltransferase n=1 Tax=Nitrospira sp. KM1 TaxID=1936990 RepID=UPI0013A76E29|nr:GNAT family N-acetyltransferase [Nitrospira sp. KM1]BCA54518.1 N-acetyltransferase [Nitrospira sp. KM1]